MSNSNSGFMPGVNNDASNVSTGGKSSGGITDKLKNLAKPESHAAGMMGMGGMGGAGGTAAASALGSNVPSVPSHTSGMSNVDTPNAHSYNHDSSHSGFGGHNPSSDSYGRDTTNSETYGRGNSNIGRDQDYSMSSDRDHLQRNTNQGTHMSGNTTSSGMATAGLGAGTGHIDESNIRHQAVDADSHLRTDTTRTGTNTGSGIHAQQYSGRSGGTSTASGVATATGHNDLSDQHHMHGQTKQAGCGMCQSGGHSMRESNSSNISSQNKMNIGGNEMGTSGHGQAKMTTSTNTGTTEGPSNLNLRPGEKVVETETRVHQGGYASGTGSGNTHNTTSTSQGTGGTGNRQLATGPVGSEQQAETGKASMTDKIIGGAEKMTGKMAGNPAMMKEGEQRAAGHAAANLSRN